MKSRASFSIKIAPIGFRSLRAVKDKKVRNEIAKAIDGLAHAPEAQGKPLLPPFEGIRSLKTVRGRFRILYRVIPERLAVWVLLVGERKAGRDADVYALAQRLVKTLLREEP